MEENKSRMAELNTILREAARAYYQESREIMSNLEYDALYDELARLEQETGIILAGSVTQNVGYEVLSQLEKVEHENPMLSLDKTKDVAALSEWMNGHEAVLSWKLDGLTIVLTYENGRLKQAVTRGNGYIGEDVTNNAACFENLPLSIPFTGRLVVRGEAVIRYSDFEEFSGEYKNPRNLCSGSVRQLDPRITKQRHVNVFIFSVVSGNDAPTVMEQFEWLKTQGFDVVGHVLTDPEKLADEVRRYEKKIETFDIPSDGLVLLLNDIAYGKSLGNTAKFPRNSIAFKWTDETEETKLKYIEWSASRTGLINPVAVFEPVEIEGSTVSRASVHNVSIMEELKLGAGDSITVYKANMIIPQIAENLTKSASERPPERCPVCGGRTEIKEEGDVRTLYCMNPDCPAKKIKSYALLASRDAMNIEGLSEMTLEKLIAKGFIREPADLFRLNRYRSEIMEMDGFGEKSADNLIKAAEKASHTTLPRFLYSLGIPGIGAANAKVISRYFSGDFTGIRRAGAEELTRIEGIGEVLAESIEAYFRDEQNRERIDELLQYVTLEDAAAETKEQVLAGKTFVITGSVLHFSNRKELQELIESLGGKAASSVSANTDYLINNDSTSTSGKNKKAKELGIPVITEEDFLRLSGLQE